MKNILLLTALVLVLPLFILSCHDDDNNNNGSDDGPTTLTENDFANDPGLRADPENGIIVKFLEHPDGEKPELDTEEVGMDTIPFRYTRTIEHTYCWEDENIDAMHFAELTDSEGSLILTVEANGECETAVITQGDYALRLHHDGITEEDISVFLQVVEGENEAATNTIDTDQGKFGTLKRLFSWTLGNIGIVETAMAQTVEENVKTLMFTGSCPRCDLHGADLTDANLSFTDLFDANLSGADLSHATLFGADLRGANLSDAVLTSANLSHANLRNAVLINTDLTKANLNIADLTNANLNIADLTNANLSFAFIIGTNLTGANLTGADLSAANLNIADLSHANLSGAYLIGTLLRGANLSNADLSFTLINGTDFRVANLTGANLAGVDLTGADLSHANLSDADLSNADLSFVLITGANLTGANLTGANLARAHLTGATLEGALWCDGTCVCAEGSVGQCGGCSAQDTCTGP